MPSVILHISNYYDPICGGVILEKNNLIMSTPPRWCINNQWHDYALLRKDIDYEELLKQCHEVIITDSMASPRYTGESFYLKKCEKCEELLPLVLLKEM